MTAAHPTDETLAAYGLGKLEDPAAGAVLSHLEGCEACRRRVAALSADSFVGRLRAGRDAGPSGGGYTGLSAAVRAMPQADDAAVPPELLTLTQYTGLKELGRGGMGVVYVAHNTDMDRPEVLKVVQRSSLERVGAGAVERFLREIQAAARLQHKNVVAAYTVHRPGDLLVFAMEYAPGQDLAKVVRAKGPLAVPVACSYVHEAALGLQHAHEAKMVHRDIKPGNLILTRVNGKPAVKVLDFGLAKVTTGDKASGDLTGDGKMMGTPDYMAPEQALDAAKADIRADVYALGCTLYYLLAGRPPFGGGSLLAVIDHHRHTEATPLNLVQPTVPAELAAAVARMMAKDPAKRYQTPLDAAKAVRPFIGQPATRPAAPPAPRPSTADTSRPEQTAPERPAPVPQPETPAAMTSGTVVVPVPAAPPPRRRGRLWAWLAVGAALNLLGGLLLYQVAFKTPHGTIHIEPVPADATVELDGATATVTRAGETVTLTAVPGEHTLRVVQNGVELAVQGGAVVRLGGQPVRVRVDPPAKPAPTPAPPPKPADPPAPAPPTPPEKLVAGSVWRGTRTFTEGSWAGTTVNFELYVQKRDGSKFSGTGIGNDNTGNRWIIEGELVGTAIRWTERHGTSGLNQSVGTLDGSIIRTTLRREWDGKPRGEGQTALALVETGVGTPGRSHVPAPPSDPGGRTARFDQVVRIAATSELGYVTGPVAKGDVVSLEYVDGRWKGWGNNATESPDSVRQEKGDRCRLAVCEVAGGKTQVLKVVPGETKNKPFEWTADKHYDKLVLRINDTDGDFKRNPDIGVQYRLRVYPAAGGQDNASSAADGFVQLFNGKDLAGWKLHPTHSPGWRVTADGYLTCTAPGRSAIWTTTDDYEDALIRAVVRTAADSSGEVAVRAGYGLEPTTGSDRQHVTGYCAHIDQFRSHVNQTGSIFVGRRPLVNRRPTPVKNGDWFTLELRVVAQDIAVSVNGVTISNGRVGSPLAARGRIALQHNNGSVEYKSIEVKRLTARPLESKPTADAAQPGSRPEQGVSVEVAPEAEAMLKAALAGKQRPLRIEPPKDLAGWGDQAKPTGNWEASDDGVLVGSGSRGMTYPQGVAHTDFYMKYEAMAEGDTHGGVVIRRRVRKVPDGQGTRHMGYYIPISTAAQDQTGQVGRWRNYNATPALAASAVRECLPRQWYAFEVVAVGGRIAVFVDGVFASFWSEPTTDPSMLFVEGVPSFRVERGTASFRNVEVKELDTADTATLPPPKR